MNLMPWRPLVPRSRGLFSPALDIERSFEQFLNTPLTRWADDSIPTTFVPRIDVRETDEGLQVRAELAGLTEKDVEVTVTPAALVIRGEKKTQSEQDSKHWQINECSYGAFERTLALPSDLDTSRATATFIRGVLTVDLPRKPEAKSEVRKVPLSVEN